MTIRFRKIDESNIGEHSNLRDEDTCLYLLEFTSRQGYSFSKANQLITNLKKKPNSSAPELDYKRRAIASCARGLSEALNDDWLGQATIIPVPCSKATGHPLFDDRMQKVAEAIRPVPNVRPLVRQTQSLVASHEAPEGQRPTVSDLLAVYEIDETLAGPPIRQLGILDDVLTAGTHFRAMHTILSNRFPGIPITGIFIARRVFPQVEI